MDSAHQQLTELINSINLRFNIEVADDLHSIPKTTAVNNLFVYFWGVF